MTGKDLMVGDWVLHDGIAKRVDVIWGDTQVSLYNPTRDWGSIYADKFLIRDLEPIPLTEEILKRNGFEKKNPYGVEYFQNGMVRITHNTFINSTKFKISADKDRDCILLCGLDFVHELQHALHFCKMCKDIKPIKLIRQ